MTFTPAGLAFDEIAHEYTLDGARLCSVTSALAAANLMDRAFFSEESRWLGTMVHAAIEVMHDAEQRGVSVLDMAIDPRLDPYLAAYRAFRADTGLRVDAVEERLADRQLQIAGTLDLRGAFPDAVAAERLDVLDVKTGVVPPWVGYQTAGYVRLLPPERRGRCRRWCLQLRGDGRYRLIPLTASSDLTVFLAAVTIAQARAGWQ